MPIRITASKTSTEAWVTPVAPPSEVARKPTKARAVPGGHDERTHQHQPAEVRAETESEQAEPGEQRGAGDARGGAQRELPASLPPAVERPEGLGSGEKHGPHTSATAIRVPGSSSGADPQHRG